LRGPSGGEKEERSLHCGRDDNWGEEAGDAGLKPDAPKEAKRRTKRGTIYCAATRKEGLKSRTGGTPKCAARSIFVK
jgi:hypothetical protein